MLEAGRLVAEPHVPDAAAFLQVVALAVRHRTRIRIGAGVSWERLGKAVVGIVVGGDAVGGHRTMLYGTRRRNWIETASTFGPIGNCETMAVVPFFSMLIVPSAI